jgi:hypothetical protein
MRGNCQIWQHTYGYNGSYEISKGVSTSYDNGFIIGVDKNSRNFIFLKPDINGNILWQKYISNIEGNEMILSHMSINPTGDILSTGGYYPSNDVNSFVLSVNNCGEIVWCKTITISNENYGKFVFSLPNENMLLLTYNASEYPGIDRTQLWEIDSEGNIIWMKQVLPGMQTYFQDSEFTQMCLTSDGGSLMAGYTYYPYDTINNPYDALLQPCLVKCNNEGEMQWVYPPLSGADTTKFGFFTSCTQIGNTYYAAGSHYQLGTEFFLRPLVARFDLNGNLLSYNYTPADSMYHELTQVVSATDTSLLLISAANTVFNDPNYLMVFIADTMGNIQKSFTRTDLVVGQFGDEVAKMRDNKFVIPCQSPLGWVGPLTDVVAIKLNANLEYDSIYTQPFTYDSLCPYPIVSDTIECNCEPFVSVKEAEKSMEKLNIAPNPAREWFTVGFEQAWQQAGILRVYDMLGRMQYEVVMPSGTKQTKVRCEGWKTGLYLVRWQSSGKVVSGKVVIK